MSPRIVAIAFAVVLATGVGGWLYGASGRSEVELARRQAVQLANLHEARALVFEGQLAVFQLNFGDAAKHFEGARVLIQRMQTALRETGQAERAGRLEVALSHLRDAQRMAVGLDANARLAADEALKVLASLQS